MKLILVLMVISLTVPTVTLGSVIQVPGDYPTIQGGIDAVTGGDTVEVYNGTYTGNQNTNIDFSGKAITVRSVNGMDLTVIDCQNGTRGFIFDSYEGVDSVLDGFTIRNGYDEGPGGGIACYGSSPLIQNCRIENCTSAKGGAIYAEDGPVIIRDCTITDNYADEGGGIYLGSCYNSTVSRCDFSSNGAFGRGGGIYLQAMRFGLITASTFYDNSAVDGGGIFMKHTYQPVLSHNIFINNSDFAIYNMMSSPAVVNCVIAENDGGIGGNKSFITVRNCTIVNQNFHSGLDVETSHFDIENSIFYDNTPYEITHSSRPPSAPESPVVSYTNVRGGYAGAGNINEFPYFAGGYFGDYYLSRISDGQLYDSPCIDTGSDLASLVCYESDGSLICMSEVTTSTHHLADDGQVDMGVHYLAFGPSPTPSPGPSATPTPIPPPFTGVHLMLDGSPFHGGDLFDLRAISRSEPGQGSAELCVLLDVYGEYWFFPDWNQEFDVERIYFQEGEATRTSILSFIWPAGDFGSAYGLYFWGAILQPNTTQVIGTLDQITFGYF